MELNRTAPPWRATRTVIGVFGLLAALAGAEHGLGEVLQGPVPPEGLVIQSWPEHEAFAALDGEPALTLIPNLLLSGILTIIVSIIFALWAVTRVHKKHGALVLAGLSIILLMVGGGFGPPLIGLIIALGAIRLRVPKHPPGSIAQLLSRLWPWFMGLGVVSYLGLVPGTLIMHAAGGAFPDGLVYAFMILAFGSLFGALAAARAHDRHRLWEAVEKVPKP